MPKLQTIRNRTPAARGPGDEEVPILSTEERFKHAPLTLAMYRAMRERSAERRAVRSEQAAGAPASSQQQQAAAAPHDVVQQEQVLSPVERAALAATPAAPAEKNAGETTAGARPPVERRFNTPAIQAPAAGASGSSQRAFGAVAPHEDEEGRGPPFNAVAPAVEDPPPAPPKESPGFFYQGQVKYASKRTGGAGLYDKLRRKPSRDET